MERYSFFDAQQTKDGFDRVYSSADMARYFSSFVGNGVYANPANSLQVRASDGLTLKVAVGKGWINGYYYELTQEEKTVTLERGDDTYPRIDNVVLRLSLSKRLVEIAVVKGTPAQSPVAPAPTRNDTTYELVLAQVAVQAGATIINDSAVTDTRPDSSLCGWVHQVVNRIDTTGLFRQYDNEFDNWFSSLRTTLDGDVAGNLAGQMADLRTDMSQKADSDIVLIQEEEPTSETCKIWVQF